MAHKTKKASSQRQPQAAHAQALDPVKEARQEEAQIVSSVQTSPASAGSGVQPGPTPTANPQQRLQDILPEIKELAQRVGGMKQLAEIVANLQQTKE